MCERSLAIREQALGSDHPDTAESLDTLAELMRNNVGSDISNDDIGRYTLILTHVSPIGEVVLK